MDTTVTGIGSVVVAELRAAGYMDSTIGQYEKTIKALKRFAEERDGVYTPSLGAQFATMTVSPRTGRFSAQRRFDYGRLVSVFDAYLRNGRVDLSCSTRGGGGVRPDSSELCALVSAWEAEMDDRALAPATRDTYGRVCRAYLVVADHGISPESITEIPQQSRGGEGWLECRSALDDHLLADELCRGDEIVAARAPSADADSAHEGRAVLAALFSEGPDPAGVALIDGDRLAVVGSWHEE